jgi:hypothetical protein
MLILAAAAPPPSRLVGGYCCLNAEFKSTDMHETKMNPNHLIRSKRMDRWDVGKLLISISKL